MKAPDHEALVQELVALRRQKLAADEAYRDHLMVCFDAGVPSRVIAVAFGTTRQNIDNILGKLTLRREREQQRRAG